MAPRWAGPKIVGGDLSCSIRPGRSNRGVILHSDSSGSMCRIGTCVELSFHVRAHSYFAGISHGSVCAVSPRGERAPFRQGTNY